MDVEDHSCSSALTGSAIDRCYVGRTGSNAIAGDIILQETRLAIVLDTDVLVAALRSDRGASRQLLMAALNGSFEILASVPLMIEYEAVLTRPEHLAASGLSSQDLDEVLMALARVVKPVHLGFLWRPWLKDAGDEMVLATAVNGGASRLVTFNVRHLASAAREFGIRSLPPGDSWKEMQERNAKK